MTVEELAAKIQRLPPAQQLQTAADLMAAGEIDVAISIAENVVAMHQYSKLFPTKP
jgi:hypothetical protein